MFTKCQMLHVFTVFIASDPMMSQGLLRGLGLRQIIARAFPPLHYLKRTALHVDAK